MRCGEVESGRCADEVMFVKELCCLELLYRRIELRVELRYE